MDILIMVACACDSRAGYKHHVSKDYLIHLKQSLVLLCGLAPNGKCYWAAWDGVPFTINRYAKTYWILDKQNAV